MKHHFHRIAIAAALTLFIAACGGKETVASKSAAAFREAQQKGTLPSGDAHGGHAAGEAATATDHSTMTGMDHSTMTDAGAMAGMDHATVTGGGQGAMAGMDHANMPGMQRGQSMAGMDHSQMKRGQSMAGMDHSQMQRGQAAAGMDHSRMQHGQQPMAGMDHSNMPGMQQRGTAQQAVAGMDHSNMPGMQHGTTGAPVVTPPPTSNAEIQRLRPASTLKNDPFDMPAQSAVAETEKAIQGSGDEGLARGITPGQDRENPPTPAPAIRDIPAQGSTSAPAMDHSQHGGQRTPAAQPRAQSPGTTSPAMDHTQHGGQSAPAAQPRSQSRGTSSTAQPAAATIYTCPMHPEVTSDKPGTCPKCGMALVKKQ